MIRKLIQLSPSTSVVSLPASWIKANNLRKGAPMSVEVKENKVLISTESAKSKKEICIDITNMEGRLMWTAIDAAYIAGYDSIIINTKDHEQAAFMTRVVRYFPGMMIYEERKSMVHFRSIGEQPEGEIDKILSRIFNLNIALIEDAMDAMKARDWDVLLKIKRRDYVINSYVSYCLRSINKFGHPSFSKIGVMHSFLKSIEIMSDKLVALFISIGEHKSELHKSRTISLILDMYRHEQRAHFRYSQDKMILLEEKRQELKKSIKKMPSYSLPFLNDIADLFFTLEELEMQLHV